MVGSKATLAKETPKTGAIADKKPAPASAPATTLEIGKPAPDFTLTSLDGKEVKLSSFKGKSVVLEWFNPDCPFVKTCHNDGQLKGLAAKHKDVVWLAINSGAPGKQGHGKETNEKGKKAFGIGYPILFDADGKVGRMYKAERTPHLYIVDKDGNLAYRGAIDNTRSGRAEDAPDGKLINYVEEALKDIAAGKKVRTPETKAYGCSVKYAG